MEIFRNIFVFITLIFLLTIVAIYLVIYKSDNVILFSITVGCIGILIYKLNHKKLS